MKVVTPTQMSEVDRICINEIGIPGIVLMENAALKVMDEIKGCLGSIEGKHIVLLAGKGNNGGDAFAVARHLFNKGAEVQVFLFSKQGDVNGDAKTNLDILKAIGVAVCETITDASVETVEKAVHASNLVVDGIFGTGLKREVSGVVWLVIDAVNASRKTVISIDIPSGICGETGRILGNCIRADRTVTFGLPKLGLIIHPGCDYVGRLSVADIGIPAKVIQGTDSRTNIITKESVRNLIPRRFSNSNKGSYGKILFVTGSRGMTGAGCLAGKAALRSGAGLVYLGVPESLTSVYGTVVPEAVTVPLQEQTPGLLSKECIPQLGEWMKKVSVAAVGPGLGARDDVADIVAYMIRHAQIPMILDADALNAVAQNVEILKDLRTKAVITPHPGEMSRLTGITIQDVQNNRIEIAREYSAKWGVIIVLKGAKTIVACPDGRVYINTTGNSGMATAGTGDVLAGIISGLTAQGADLEAASIAGVHIHGLAGDRVAGEKGEYGLIAGDLVEEIPYGIREAME